MSSTMKTPTIYDVKYATMQDSPYYFDHHTMKSFGQTMRSFHVSKTDTEGVFLVWARSKYGGISRRWYASGFGRLYLNEESAIEAVKTGVDPYK